MCVSARRHLSTARPSRPDSARTAGLPGHLPPAIARRRTMPAAIRTASPGRRPVKRRANAVCRDRGANAVWAEPWLTPSATSLLTCDARLRRATRAEFVAAGAPRAAGQVPVTPRASDIGTGEGCCALLRLPDESAATLPTPSCGGLTTTSCRFPAASWRAAPGCAAARPGIGKAATPAYSLFARANRLSRSMSSALPPRFARRHGGGRRDAPGPMPLTRSPAGDRSCGVI
jgi:hypothetical protein